MTQYEMTPKQLEAYRLAEERIAEAKADRHKFLNLSGTTIEFEHAGEERVGDERFRHLTRIPPEITELTWLTGLDLGRTKIFDLSPLRALIALNRLWLSGTLVTDLSPLRGFTTLEALSLSRSFADELSPLIGLDRLKALYFRGIPALDTDPRLKELLEIPGTGDRTRQTLAYLREKYPPEPPPLTEADLPDPDEILPIVQDEDGRLDVPAGAPTPEEAADPLRQKLHQRLRENVTLLERKGNRFYVLETRVRRLARALEPDLAEVDLVDVYLELEELRVDLSQDNAARDDPYDTEVLTQIQVVIDQGGGLVLGTAAVEPLEQRKAQMRETAPSDPGGKIKALSERIIADREVFAERLRQYLEITRAGESDRLQTVERTLQRNVLLKIGKWVLLVTAGGVIGNSAFAAIQWLAMSEHLVLAATAIDGAWGAEWLGRMVEQAKQIVAAGKGSGATRGRDPRG